MFDLIELDQKEIFNWAAWKAIKAAGILDLVEPIVDDATGTNTIQLIERLIGQAVCCRDNGLNFSLNAHIWACLYPILKFGSADQKRRYKKILIADACLGAFCVTEKTGGSDVGNISCSAYRNNGFYVLNGEKTLITNAPIADVFVVLARDRSLPGGPLSAFIVDRGAQGLNIGAPISKMGLRTAQMGGIALSNCILSPQQLLGAAGQGMAVFNAAMTYERAFILSIAVGSITRMLEKCHKYAKGRTQKATSLLDHQAVRAKLANMRVRQEVSHSLIKETARKFHTLNTRIENASICKTFISKMWIENSIEALSIHGGNGYLTQNEVEREVRDSLAAMAFSGTEEIQKEIISKFSGLHYAIDSIERLQSQASA